MRNRLRLTKFILFLSILLLLMASSNIVNANKDKNQNRLFTKFNTIFSEHHDMENTQQIIEEMNSSEQKTSPKEPKEETPKIKEEVLVLMYHHITEVTNNGSTISPKDFRDQMVWMKKNNFTFLSMQEFYDIVYKEKPIPPKAVLITFDDGYRSVYEYAYPIAKEFEIPMSFFIILKSMEDEIGIPKVSKDELKEMKESGYFYIGNHTYDMHYKGEGDKAMLAIASKKQIIEDIQLWLNHIEYTDFDLRAFVYPYGIYSKRTLQALKEMDYKLAFTVKPGVYNRGDTPLLINRVNAGGQYDTIGTFIRKVKVYTNFNLK